MTSVRICCAGWAVPPHHRDLFPVSGSHLARYATLFDAVEINTSFYRPHRRATYERWAETVPPGFRFAVKVPQAWTHVARLAVEARDMADFVAAVDGLGEKRGPLLVQLPPSLSFEDALAAEFFAKFRTIIAGPIVCEPRHASWFTSEAAALLARHHVARVMADPLPVPEAAQPGGWDGFVYRRLHGSPEIYYSAYGEEYLGNLARQIRETPVAQWCVFDNTARGAAAANALSLVGLLRDGG
ncbi:hypothetical protein AA101099_2829 [Neoasaia chiangmaiensis NBRC 101099]|uniref:Uncharacterized protein n=1 Tax=Neoasaia chiangmaiensis TaxID=320497 RepID=A0A1U9KP14_9PROT|nr:DUF72 domain-containing protein [Neoasaia chiangmaiensis]AQS87548.1 hypothetical protein A0U93_05910 [Neoasaia chiangmaiensis]GBR42312.1 hypothetical protein AA101099_2829 [Neoasaia chiangmaiensis NBRC 101099]GEN14093.1 hypothetical protein NCH01_05240 [Neoasaia chiangmaiensis]